jgi:imidazolonepropionase-like amidohydrolase
MGGLLRELDEWRVKIEAGVLVGPRIIRAGPVLNGRQFGFQQFVVTNESEARGAVRALQKAGVDCIKVHRAITREAYFGALDECKKLKLPLVGHIPNMVTPREASDAGQASLEHVSTLFDGTFATDHKGEPFATALEQFTREDAPALFARFASNGTAFTPTLVSQRMVTQFGRAKPNERDKYVSRSAKKSAEDLLKRDKAELTADLYERFEQQFKASLPLVKLMQRAGIRLLAGTDLATAGTYPGFDLHDELALMVQAGLTPMEALQSATRNAADVLKLNDSGTIAVGKSADLVLLDANPLDDIRNSQKISAVILGGRLFDRKALGDLLRDAEQAARAE